MSICPIREAYIDALKGSLASFRFRGIVSGLLAKDEFFFSGYLEMLWVAEEEKYDDIHEKILRLALQKIELFLSGPDIKNTILDKENGTDLWAIIDILETATRSRSLSFWNRGKVELALVKAQALQKIVLKKQSTDTHLKLLSSVDVIQLKQELVGILPYWWLVEVTRQQKIISHRDTSHILIRARPSAATEFKSFDGIHESVPTTAAETVPQIHNAILSLAKELNISLGGVNLVKMNPWSQSYRHWDSEPQYTGRNRYHLILSCGEGNVLSSGNDTVIAKEGEVWFFDNKADRKSVV